MKRFAFAENRYADDERAAETINFFWKCEKEATSSRHDMHQPRTAKGREGGSTDFSPSQNAKNE